MNKIFTGALALTVTALASAAVAQVTFYESDSFQGQSFTTRRQVENFQRYGFNDRASSVVVLGDQWEVCEDIQYRGRCVVLREGSYPSMAAIGLNNRISSVRVLDRNTQVNDQRYAPPAPAVAEATFYEVEGYQGESFTTTRQVGNLRQFGFNDRASSIVITGSPWEVCQDAAFGGRCVVLRPGSYPSMASMGLNDRVSSVRAVAEPVRADDSRYAPPPQATYDARRRNNERLYQAPVTSVRAVVGTPEQRCWVEREQVAQDRSNPNMPGAIAGALIGGILGHQVGGGSGKDLATAGGVIAGAVVGSNVGRDSAGTQASTQNVQRCASTGGPVRPTYWDVSYTFRGIEHRVQMNAAPGSTVTVNRQGEPRV